jgi:hypothetical protein
VVPIECTWHFDLKMENDHPKTDGVTVCRELWKACQRGDHGVVCSILAQNAARPVHLKIDVEYRSEDWNEVSCLTVAATQGHPLIVCALLKEGALPFGINTTPPGRRAKKAAALERLGYNRSEQALGRKKCVGILRNIIRPPTITNCSVFWGDPTTILCRR